jgi:hypothetical protein
MKKKWLDSIRVNFSNLDPILNQLNVEIWNWKKINLKIDKEVTEITP